MSISVEEGTNPLRNVVNQTHGSQDCPGAALRGVHCLLSFRLRQGLEKKTRWRSESFGGLLMHW